MSAIVIRLPNGSSFGQRLRAIASLIVTTSGPVSVSCSVNSRPRSSGIRIAEK